MKSVEATAATLEVSSIPTVAPATTATNKMKVSSRIKVVAAEAEAASISRAATVEAATEKKQKQ